MSTRNDCRPGISNAFTTPSKRRQHEDMPHLNIAAKSVSAARMNASSIDAVCVRDHDMAPVAAIGGDPAERRKQKDRDLAGEPHRSQQQRRTSQPVDEPRLRHGLHPGADQRDQLSAEEELEVAMTQRPSSHLPARSAFSGAISGPFAAALSGIGILRFSHCSFIRMTVSASVGSL